MDKPLTYEKWLEKNEDEFQIHCSENGCGYEPDFDFEQYCEDQYEHYLKSFKNDKN